MSLKKNKDLKLYFSISEVAQMFDVNESTLRFWEKEFDIINPRKTSKRYPFLQAGGYTTRYASSTIWLKREG